jgi:hypothetical protein
MREQREPERHGRNADQQRQRLLALALLRELQRGELEPRAYESDRRRAQVASAARRPPGAPPLTRRLRTHREDRSVALSAAAIARERALRALTIAPLAHACVRSAAVEQQADRDAHGRRDADRLPRMVVHVVVGRTCGFFGAVDGLALQFLQLQLGGEQLASTCWRRSRAFAGLGRCGLQQRFGFGKDGAEIVDESFAGDSALAGMADSFGTCTE